jgi:hypothetical protein
VTGTLPVANGGTGVTTSTGSGANVLSTSPTLTTPISASLTSPAASNLTLGTGSFGAAFTLASATGAMTQGTFATFQSGFNVNSAVAPIDTASSGALGLKLGVLTSSPSNSTDAFVGVQNTGGPGALAGDLLYIARSSVAASHRWFTGNGGAITSRMVLNNAGDLSLSSTTASTSTTTGSLINAGGFGNAGAIFAGGTITSATASHNSITAAAATNLTLAGGSSGASLLLSQGANGRATLSAKGTEAVLLIGRNQSNTSTPSFSFYQQNQGPGNEYLDIGFLESPFSTWFQARRVSGSTGSSISLQPADGNVLIGGTTDISGTGGLKVFGTTASTSTTTGSLVNAGGFGNAGAAWFGGQINSASSGLLFSRTGASTALQYLDIANTGGRVQFGVETSTGGNFFGGATAYATVLASATSAPVQIAVNAIHAATFSSTAVSIPLTTASTSTTTGSLVNAGGFGNAGAIYTQTLNINGTNSAASYPLTVRNNALKASASQYTGILIQTADAQPVDFGLLYFTAVSASDRNWRLGAFDNGGGGWSKGTFPGVISITDTTASTSTTTGSLVNAGGFGNAGAAYIGGNLTVSGAGTSVVTGQLFGAKQTQAAVVSNTITGYGLRLRAADGGTGFISSGIGFSDSGTVDVGTVLAAINTTDDGTGGATGLAFYTGATAGMTQALKLDSSQNATFAGAATFSNSVRSTSATAGIGYGTGAGGAVTQGTSRTTGVTLNNVCGAITLFTAAGSATWQSFTVTNSTVAATDTIIVNQRSGTDLYMMHVTAVGAGSFRISFATTGGTTSEAPVFNFAVIKAVSS